MMEGTQVDIPIFIPAFNEEKTIGEVLSALKSMGYWNLFIVNDGSEDRTIEEAKQAGAKVITHLINRGAGASTQTAIEWAKKAGYPYIVLMDGDGQHAPTDIHKLIECMNKGKSDIVIGSRFLQNYSAMPVSRRWYNKGANLLTNLFCENRYTDTQSGFRMFNRRAIEQMQLTLDEYGFCSEMIILAEQNNLRITEVPIKTIYTDYSLAKGQGFFMGIRTAFSFLWKVIFK